MAPLAAHAELRFSGRVSVLGAAASPREGDAGQGTAGPGTPTADQQSLRLMLDGQAEGAEWSIHLKAARQHLRGFPTTTRHSSELFRARALADDHLSTSGASRTTRLGWEIDRASYKHRFGKVSISFGRQPIDWGSGRFWQPLNVFGAFAPTDLDTDYKPGIDAAVLNWYPGSFSSLAVVHAFAPRDDPAIADSTAIHYRRQVGETSQLALVAGRVIGDRVFGASFESDWRGIGWRVEALQSKLDASGENALLWIAGVDYQFGNGALVSLEWYDNERGASTEAGLPRAASGRLVAYGLQQHASRRVLGVSVGKDLTPLLRASYTLLAAPLRGATERRSVSLMHQLALVYSLSNESDLLLALSGSGGKGLDASGGPRSEFGHVPASVTLRWRFYF
ncbi:MAG: hypothetical protein KJZ83_12450 [Burkholderiaceae bacterium]|nr:hypothetical protein [Burkholderiaceae bacterium]